MIIALTYCFFVLDFELLGTTFEIKIILFQKKKEWRHFLPEERKSHSHRVFWNDNSTLRNFQDKYTESSRKYDPWYAYYSQYMC